MRWFALVVAIVAVVGPASMAGCLGQDNNAWAAHATQIDALRARGLTGAGVRVAILDTGIDLGHPSLAHLGDGRTSNGEVVAYADFLGVSEGPGDRGGHGTFVAGILAARSPQGLAAMANPFSDVDGLAPGVELLVGRVCDEGDCSILALWKALEWALANDADVVSLSLGFTPDLLADRPLIADGVRAALVDAEAKGVLVVAAAGNGARGETVLFPANVATVLAVGATDRHGQVRATSLPGDSRKPDLVAPGEGVTGPSRGSGRVQWAGTSTAVPFVVAAAALIIGGAADPEDGEGLARLRQALYATADPVAGQARPHDLRSGFGIVQADDAYEAYRGQSRGR